MIRAAARSKRKSVQGIFFHLLAEGSVELWSCRAHLLLNSWLPNVKGYKALARAALASCERGLEFMTTMNTGIALAPPLPKDVLLSHAIRAAVVCREHKKASEWLSLVSTRILRLEKPNLDKSKSKLSTTPTALNVLAKADVALIYRQTYEDALTLYQQAAELNERPGSSIRKRHPMTSLILFMQN